MRVLQLNANHSETAQDLLAQTIREESIDAVLLSEPYRVLDNVAWTGDSTGRAAIWATGRYPIQEKEAFDGFVRAKMGNTNFLSCYASPAMEPDEFERYMDRVVEEASKYDPVVIAGDFNAWAVEWGSRATNARGHVVLEATSRLKIVLANVGRTSTFSRNGRESIVDLTFVSEGLYRDLQWKVSEGYTYSDHRAILFETGHSAHGTFAQDRAGRGWVTRFFGEELFGEAPDFSGVSLESAEEAAESLIKCVKRACDTTMPRRGRVGNGRPMVYWWDESIKELRDQCHKARRKYQRSIGTDSCNQRQEEYKKARRILKKEIKEKKRKCFKKLIDDADANPWGSAYKVVMSKFANRSMPKERDPDRLQQIVHKLFPRHALGYDHPDVPTDAVIPEVTQEEVIEASRKIKINKAPGPDALPNEAVITAVRHYPELITEVMGKCVKEGIFPERWKLQTLVLIPKMGKDASAPVSYRPICLIDTFGKILEGIVAERLRRHTDETGAISPKQYGFRKGRSTIDAIEEVTSSARKTLKQN